MKTISIKEIDKLIESELTNIKSQSQSQNFEFPNMDDLNKDFTSYLDNTEKEEKDKLTFKSKLRSIDNDPNRRRTSDIDIKNGKERIAKIQLLKREFEKKKQELVALQKQQQQMAIQAQNNQQASSDNDQNQSQNTFKSVLRQQIRETIRMEKNDSLPIITRGPINNVSLTETAPQVPLIEPQQAQLPTPGISPVPAAPKKIIKVNFDTKTDQPFQAEFTERGFLIGSTRLSFEVIETALSKNFVITLDNGKGLVLDAIKMQKILKYKNRI